MSSSTDFFERAAIANATSASSIAPAEHAQDEDYSQALKPLPGGSTIESLNRQRRLAWIPIAALTLGLACVGLIVFFPDMKTVAGWMRGETVERPQEPPKAISTPVQVVDDTPEPTPPSTTRRATAPIEIVPNVEPPPLATNPGTHRPDAPALSKSTTEIPPAPVDIRLRGDGILSTAQIAPNEPSTPHVRTSVGNNISSNASTFTGDTPETAPKAAQGPIAAAADTVSRRINEGSGKFAIATAKSNLDRSRTVLAGSSIPCTLDDAVDTSLPGIVTCTLQRDVYSDDGSCKVLTKGNRGVGEYLGRQEQGQHRVFVIWQEIQGRDFTIDAGSMTTDNLGRAGVGGDYDSRFMERFRGALVLSVVNNATSKSSNGVLIQPSKNSAEAAMETDMKIPAVTTLPQASLISIRVARHWVFRTCS